MSSRQRRAQRRSNLSSRVDTRKDGVSRVYFRQDEVLKPTAAGLDEDSYPVYLLEAATLYTVDGEDIASLLEVGVKGSVEVRGRLTILPDEAEMSHCKHILIPSRSPLANWSSEIVAAQWAMACLSM